MLNQVAGANTSIGPNGVTTLRPIHQLNSLHSRWSIGNLPSLPHYLTGTSHIEAIGSDLTDRQYILTMLKKKLLKAQQAMKLYADKKRIPHQSHWLSFCEIEAVPPDFSGRQPM